MSYIIVQLDKEAGFDGVDAMINQEGTALQTFQTREEAAIFLAEFGLRELEFAESQGWSEPDVDLERVDAADCIEIDAIDYLTKKGWEISLDME